MTTPATDWPVMPLPKGLLQDRQEKFRNLLLTRLGAGQHLWVAVVAYVLHPERRKSGDPLLLSPDDLTGPPDFACYICEQPWTSEREAEACFGEPQD